MTLAKCPACSAQALCRETMGGSGNDNIGGLLNIGKLDLSGGAVEVTTDLTRQSSVTSGELLCQRQTLQCLKSLPCNTSSSCSPVGSGPPHPRQLTSPPQATTLTGPPMSCCHCSGVHFLLRSVIKLCSL